jgi:hypothetical protein
LRTEDGTRSTEWAAASAGKEKLEPLSYRIIEVQSRSSDACRLSHTRMSSLEADRIPSPVLDTILNVVETRS